MEKDISTRTITITSGKGGVGKTNICVNLALALAKEGRRTCLFDADLGLANINILLGLDPEYTLEDVISGRKELNDILIKDFNGIDIFPGSSGVEKIANLEKEDIQRVNKSLSALSKYDLLIFDTSAGVSNSVIAFCMAASEVLVVITPEPTSMTDAYAVIKLLAINDFKGVIRIVVNQCKDFSQAKKIYKKFNNAVQAYLNIDISLAGIMLADQRLVESVRQQEAFLLRYPDSNASKCIRYMAKALLSNGSKDLVQDMTPFWEKCFHVMKSSLIKKKATKTLNHNDIQDGKKGAKPSSPLIEQGKIVDLMDKLVHGVMTVSEELRQIKESLGNRRQPDTEVQQAKETETSTHDEDKKILKLDYDEFIKNYSS